MIVSDEFERMWKEAVMSYFTVLSQHFLEPLRKTTQNFSQDSQSLAQELKLGPFEYKGVLTAVPQSSMLFFFSAYEGHVLTLCQCPGEHFSLVKALLSLTFKMHSAELTGE
jgi:hypothetical protein